MVRTIVSQAAVSFTVRRQLLVTKSGIITQGGANILMSITSERAPEQNLPRPHDERSGQNGSGSLLPLTCVQLGT